MLYEYKKPDICPYTVLLNYEQDFGKNNFSESCKEYLKKFGFLTPKQISCLLSGPPLKYSTRNRRISVPIFDDEEGAFDTYNQLGE